ncbi:hypothetical protein SAMN05421738_101145 [Algoriella xinjiangensis]|uniref:Uncharacterized protein n=1 Tax=Algoriella xinjiangensis TaxID=684065 RepID=A0A1I4SCM9_9FLAO|nr:DUF6268 family outer membrane beta-barrel protein [Algoriella xinjiangensis]SFM62043.1 hypothetical protein SAMN05421738_101145 [Algoriella xinjiangensis]VDH16000.1 Uncharacterised protein [Algoriella xinjiangensis]
MKYSFLILSLFAITVTNGQTNDTILSQIKENSMAFIADKFDFAKPLNVSFTQLTPYNFTLKSKNGDLANGEINNFSQAKASINTVFLKKKKWLLGASVGYEMTNISTDVKDTKNNPINSLDNTFHYHYSSVNFTYFSKLFNKRMIYTSSVIVDGSEQHFERVKGLITGTLILKSDEKTKMLIGLVAVIDPSSQVPILPTFTYERKLNNGWTLDVLMPQRVMIKKDIAKSGRLSFGSELAKTSFYIYDINASSDKFEFRQTELNNGLIYEHLLGKSFVFTAKTGYKYIMNSRIFNKDESFKNYSYELDSDPTFYINAGISFNPFFKKK